MLLAHVKSCDVTGAGVPFEVDVDRKVGARGADESYGGRTLLIVRQVYSQIEVGIAGKRMHEFDASREAMYSSDAVVILGNPDGQDPA